MNDTMKFFTDGEAYERLMGRWSRLVGMQFLDWLALPGGLHWLDVGCGNGAFTETLIAHCKPGNLDAVDPSPDQIAHANSRSEANTAKLQVGDAQSLQFADNNFDAATMALVISFVPDAPKAVSEMMRVVKPGGTVAAYMWEAQSPDSVPTHPLQQAANELGFGGMRIDPPSRAFSSREGFESLWREVGLTAVETRRINIEVCLNDLDDFWDSFTTLPNPSARFLNDLSSTDVGRVRTWLDKNLPRDSSGNIRYGAYANAVKGLVPA